MLMNLVEYSWSNNAVKRKIIAVIEIETLSFAKMH